MLTLITTGLFITATFAQFMLHVSVYLIVHDWKLMTRLTEKVIGME